MVVMVVTPDPLQRIQHLYHFTDVSNLPKIAARVHLPSDEFSQPRKCAPAQHANSM
jgi:hypothetical protein